MARRPNGFTLIELMVVVVIIGVLAAIAILRLQSVKEKAIISSLKSDLHNVAVFQSAFEAANNDFAGALISTGTPSTAGAGAGQILFSPSPGNQVTITYRSITGYSAIATNAKTTKQCGVFVGDPSYSPNAAVTSQNVPDCW